MLDLVVRDVSAAVSTRRLQLIKELQGLLDDGAAPPHTRSHGGSSAQQEPKTSVPLAFPPISMSVQLDTVGTLIVNDGDEDGRRCPTGGGCCPRSVCVTHG